MTGPETDETAPDLPDGDQPETKEKRKHALPFWVELPLLVLAALVVAVVIKTFLIQAFYIPSGSMEDTLQLNDRVMVNKLAYQFGDLQRGDIVVFDDPRGTAPPQESLFESMRRNVGESVGISVPRSEFIKRIIGRPGERIEIRDNHVLINGQPIDEPYIKLGSAMPDMDPLIVPEGEMFVMG
ncbi:MAG: signal peptidase I, partial [Acidimicrobiia bacterium]